MSEIDPHFVVIGFSPFILCIASTYATAIAWVVVLSIGEALWSPRLYEYAVIIAPKGRVSFRIFLRCQR
mgnify:CR=1 FL=1